VKSNKILLFLRSTKVYSLAKLVIQKSTHDGRITGKRNQIVPIRTVVITKYHSFIFLKYFPEYDKFSGSYEDMLQMLTAARGRMQEDLTTATQ
jgi:hypothetical protein